MMNLRKWKRGFTLVEILIVVVIVAVLAAMILPKFLSQTEAGFIQEAQHNLGVIRRALNTTCNVEECAGVYAVIANMNVANDAKKIGLGTIAATNWTYSTAANGTSTATRVGAAGKSIALTIDGVFSCPGYTLISAAKGCKAS